MENNTIIVGTSADNPPYELLENNTVIGIDIDVIEAIAKEMGKTLVIKNLDFPALLPALISKDVDMLIAGLSRTPEREKHTDFSSVYYTSQMSLIYNTNNPIQVLDDLNSKVIGAQQGTTWEKKANELAEQYQLKSVKSLPNNLVLIEELKLGNVDGVILETLQVGKFAQVNPNLSYIDLPDTTSESEFVIVLQKNSKLTKEVNAAIEKISRNGILNKIKTKWLAKVSE